MAGCFWYDTEDLDEYDIKKYKKHIGSWMLL